ncbi:MAG: hypothetical protein COT81_04025 [Candidatus Buchananbacteria bacterium CG10_big_fil_rev_8_21_14_0_10_42_9]|uniref:Uncharacterized protein n=1 Tax=Candidatus Buchananbacteria bacterium CG10_big_fil_rev_8_21_14_0_10_42_9 TaxID=1974526 RepID=A0A2H0W2Q1_9BACT|nr:MAG: hypothetical protein COT81_04025 [Candidatus Buchananbacteria bacterium CG10_big_fil_rev_8_21_14_0_10_42_9]
MVVVINQAPKIKKAIEGAKKILIVSHQKPDGDTLGSASALLAYLKSQNRDCLGFCVSPVPQNYNYLPHMDSFTTSRQTAKNFNPDLTMVVDSGDLDYAGAKDVVTSILEPHILVNIDHHKTNTGFGDINCVDVEAASTTEIVLRLFQQMGIKVSDEMAVGCLTGIITDTNSFTNPNTRAETLNSAGDLLSAGATITTVNNQLIKNKDLKTLKVWGKILSRLTYDPETKMASTAVFLSDLDEAQIDDEAVDGVANFLNSLGDVKVALVLKEMPGGMVKGSFRTNDDFTDVSELAKLLGGGGHKKAAGFSLPGKITQTQAGWQVVSN